VNSLDTRWSLSRTRCGAGMTVTGVGMRVKGGSAEARALGKEEYEIASLSLAMTFRRNFLTSFDDLTNWHGVFCGRIEKHIISYI